MVEGEIFAYRDSWISLSVLKSDRHGRYLVLDVSIAHYWSFIELKCSPYHLNWATIIFHSTIFKY